MSVACPQCGRLNRAGARFCASCQTPLNGSSGPLTAGQLLGGGAYRVVRPLGKGGMGAVWLVAQTRAFDRLAVLKEVIEYFDPADAEERSKAVERFEAEGRTLAELKHPGIPDLYAYFSEGGHNYLVMELIEGQDLSQGLTRTDHDTGQVIPGAPLAAELTARYAIQVCEVLEYLAGRQPPVVHNDIKPANIIIDSHSSRAVLVDFGTAKTRYLRAKGGPDRKRASVYGTVGYAAPELYQGRSEPRSDVYSLAATVYHLLTDDDPRDHPGQYSQLDILPAPIAGILRSALATAVYDRPSAGELRQQLESYLAGRTSALQVLAFPDGDTANGRDELLSQAVKHWGYTAGLLQDGTLVRWLRGTLRDAAATQAAEEAVKRWPGNPDAALDDFMRRVDPAALPPGSMEVRTQSLRLPAVSPRQPVRQAIEVANRGQGYLRGEAWSTQEWLKVDGAFGCPPGGASRVSVEIDASRLIPGESYVGAVTLTPAGGSPEVIAVEIAVAPEGPLKQGKQLPPAIRVDLARVELAASRQALSSSRERIMVANVGEVPARCRVLGAPAWLIVKPEAFELAPGARQSIELVGRVDKLQGRGQAADLAIAVEGGQGWEVRVTFQVKGGGLFG